ncbi:MAG TPA: CDP-alcohol phosphatidyltransferase family protein [Polyangia bacterium]|nr:CDP-alcohol phosphatidyltransferase family protein [Polyangia bacterium]
MSLFSQIADSYRRTKKPKDILWNRLVARPLAAVLLVPLARTHVTPNQVTFASLAVFVAAAALLVGLPGWTGLLIAVAAIELSYVLDCVDGQLARLRGTSSPVGAHLDFLMDELKAFMLVAATGARLWRAEARTQWLVEALAGLVAVASAISLTTFVRRPEYLRATGAPRPQTAGDYGDGLAGAAAAPAPSRSLVGRAAAAVESLGRLIIHYPSYLVFVAAANRLDLFLHVYLAINAAYAGRTILAVLRKLGRSGA